MDSQYAFATRDDIWRVREEMNSIFAVQREHADRIQHLERQKEEDARMKNVWGGGPLTPFSTGPGASIHSESTFHPATEAFKSFDNDQQPGLINSMHLDSEEEPRRGASRANSVRFDESALHGSHYSSGTRTPGELFPIRTGSALSSHPMTERSYSHRSEGRQSSSGMSHHSVRTNSLGLESSRLLGSTAISPVNTVAPPPGLFLLGPVPCIIRCWLTENYSNDSLLYAAVCTGSYRSSLSMSMVQRLGYGDLVLVDAGVRKIKLPVYLPEATISQSSSRSGSPAPQLPTLTVTFVVRETDPVDKSIHIHLASDVLKAHSADILFSKDRISMFDDERNLVSIPFVRPESDASYKDLFTTSTLSAATSAGDDLTKSSTLNIDTRDHGIIGSSLKPTTTGGETVLSPVSMEPAPIGSERDEKRKAVKEDPTSMGHDQDRPHLKSLDTDKVMADDESRMETPTRTESGNIWGSWRRETTGNKSDTNLNSSFGSNRSRPRGMKVLKPTAKTMASSTRGLSLTGNNNNAESTGTENTAPKFSETLKKASVGSMEGLKSATSPSSESKSNGQATSQSGKPRTSNPVGGASAFGWLNG